MSLQDLQDLKNRSTSSFKTLQKQLESQSSGYVDDRSWYPQRDEKTGTASAVIRFLPSARVDGDFQSFIQYYQHSFKINDKWYIENCPTTKWEGQQFGGCPVCEANREVYNRNPKDVAKTLTAGRTRRAKYVSNILIIKDPANPENDGKVKLFIYGNEIYNLIAEKIKPKFADDVPVNPFDFWSGCNLNFKIYKDKGNVKYDKSTWSDSSVLGTDEHILEIWDQCYSLKQYFNETVKFKPFDQLVKRWKIVNNEFNQTESYNHVEDDLPFDNDVPHNLGRSSSNDTDDLMNELQSLLD